MIVNTISILTIRFFLAAMLVQTGFLYLSIGKMNRFHDNIFSDARAKPLLNRTVQLESHHNPILPFNLSPFWQPAEKFPLLFPYYLMQGPFSI